MTAKGDLTSKENLAIDLILERLGESRINRTREEYAAIIAQIQRYPLKVLHGWVNDKLKEYQANDYAPFEICYFKVGDRHHWYEEFPKSLSIETVRSALVEWGVPLRRPRKH